jgi:predicted Zn-dependent peptidase
MTFRDTGLFNVYFASEKKYLEKCIRLIEKEFDKLKTEKISTSWLTRYKYQLKGQIAIAQENKAGLMLNNAKNVLIYNKPLNIPEVFRKIDAITSDQILDVANEVLDKNRMSSLLYSTE